MSIDALIAGRLCGKPQTRTVKEGTATYVTCKVRVATSSAENVVYVSVIAFGETVKAALLALEYGDSVAIAGELKAAAYIDKQEQPKPSLDLTAHAVLTHYHVRRKRNAVEDHEMQGEPHAA